METNKRFNPMSDLPGYLLGTSHKIDLSNQSIEKKGYLSTIMYLAPSDMSDVINVCPFATPECKASCLVTSSYHMNLKASEKARLDRTLLFKFNKPAFKALLYKNIRKHVKKAISLNLIPVVRLNGTSDLPWETIFPDMFVEFSNVIFYDYTKYPVSKRQNLPSNYYLLRSHSEENHSQLKEMLQVGNVAVVFAVTEENIPTVWNGHKVINGSKDDLRFLDPKNVIVGLCAKGKAKKAKASPTSFVVSV